MKKEKRESQKNEVKPLANYAIPEGYEEQTNSDDVVGFWAPQLGPIHFVPLYAKAFDSRLEPTKASVVIVGRAIGKVPIVDEDGAPAESEDGDTVGVWYKPGMNVIKDFADVKVFMQATGEINVGKDNPMKTFSVSVRKGARGNVLRISDDFRKRSAHTSLPFEMKARRRPGPAEDTDEFGPPERRPSNGVRSVDDDIPFG